MCIDVRRFLAQSRPVPRTEISEERAARRRALGLRLAVLRQRAGITKEVLAERLGVVRYTILRWETGASEPYASDLASVARELGVTVGQIAGEEPIEVTPAELAGVGEGDLEAAGISVAGASRGRKRRST